ncbi:hypothetical protein LPB67_07550 [Undibacterium sp. Jales W-56]|uniref:hypothetical protein n=1 Tax=Undibacterium sp. Jales W-56 TaxID=2897325 RepID=UPI0021D12CC8|nr:hypothetical protein [Undibacterium sp. Jales W-56]MCU6433631.1 hypothetical protein [Undibacterium sp. Jales W-56]
MFPKILLPPIKTVAKYAFGHALFTAFFFLGPCMYVAFGLGFKDKEKWTIVDQFLAVAALPIANILTMPGRFFTWDGIEGIVIPALITSAIWGIFLSIVFASIVKWRGKT